MTNENKFNQLSFQQYFVDHVPHKSWGPSFLEQIIPVGKLDCQRALETYHNDYRGRLTEALGDFYESIWMVLGDEDFFSLCELYIQSHPSKSFDLGQYGQEFPSFLARQKALEDFPFLEDLANVEKNFLEVFHQRKSIPSQLEEQELKDLHLYKLIFCPGFKIERSKHPVVSVWKCKNQDLAYDQISFDQAESFVFYKNRNGTFIHLLTNFQWQTLTSLFKGNTVQHALESSDCHEMDPGERIDQTKGLFQFIVQSEIVEKYKKIEIEGEESQKI